MKNDPSKGGTFLVNGVEFCWSIAHKEGHANTRSGHTGKIGLAILVERADGNGRPLLLQFDPSYRHRTMPRHPKIRIPDCRLIAYVERAIEAGWDSESRGKKMVFQAGMF